ELEHGEWPEPSQRLPGALKDRDLRALDIDLQDVDFLEAELFDELVERAAFDLRRRDPDGERMGDRRPGQMAASAEAGKLDELRFSKPIAESHLEHTNVVETARADVLLEMRERPGRRLERHDLDAWRG